MGLEPLRVLEFINTSVRGGAEEHLLLLLRGLDRSRFRLFLACRPVLAEQLIADVPSDVEILPIDFSEPYKFVRAWQFGAWLQLRKIDLVHSHMFYSSLCASPVARLAGVKAIVETSHGREHWRRGWLKSRFVVDRMIARSVDAIIAVSEATAEYVVMEKKLPPDKIHVIQNGISLARYEGGEGTRVRQRLHIPAEDPVVVSIGRLEPQKGHRVLLDAMALLHKDIPYAWLVLVGNGSLRAVLEQQACDLRLGGRVRFVGWQKSVADWLALADVVVLASFYEGLPLTALEALAARRPVVATAVDGTREVIRHGLTGLTVPAGDGSALARAMRLLIEDRRLAERLSRAGNELVRTRFTESRQLADTAALYESLCAHRRGTLVLPQELPSGRLP